MWPKSRFHIRRSGANLASQAPTRSGLALQVRRRRSVHKLGRNALTEVVQDDVLREEVARACRPRYRIEPHSFRLTHVRASIFRGLDAPQWSGVAAGSDLGVRSRMAAPRNERLGDEVTWVYAGNPAESGAQPDARLLGDEHDV